MLDFDKLVNCTPKPPFPERMTRWLPKAQLWLWLAVMVCSMVSLSFGQETRATLGGKVLDPQGMVVAGARVTVTAEATGVQQKVTTNDTGNWRVQGLIPGPYHFDVEASGFKKATQSGIDLRIADQKFIDTTMTIGAASDTVTVEAAVPLIDTTAAVSGTIIANDHLAELPSQSNVATLLVGLTPGAIVNPPTGGAGAVHLFANLSASDMRVNGAGWGQRSMNFTLDGASNTRQDGAVAFVPPMEALSEFKVITNAYDASIGNFTGATVNMSLKSGTSDFHGGAYEKNQNNTLNAKNWEIRPGKPVPPVHVNEWGATFGGPVMLPKLYNGREKKTFFFVSYDGIRNKTPGATGYMSVPTMLERQGDFSQSFTTVNGTKTWLQVYNPFSYTVNPNGSITRAQFPNNKIPSDMISPMAAGFLKLMPAPQTDGDGSCSSCNNYLKQTTQTDKFVSFASKFDQAWNDKHRSYVSLRYNDWSQMSYDEFGIKNSPLLGLSQLRTNKGLTVDHAWVISPTLLADLRYNVTAWDTTQVSPTVGMEPTQYGVPASLVSLMAVPSIPQMLGIVGGVDAVVGGPGTNQSGYTKSRTHEFGTSLTQTWNNHTFKYGVNYTVQQWADGNLWQAGGQFSFTNNWTVNTNVGTIAPGAGSTFASFLLGLPNSGKIGVYPTSMWSQHATGLYFQDDWRVTDKLTLNLGMRWDYQRPTTDRFNRFYTYDPTINLADITNAVQPNYAPLLTANATANTGLALIQTYGPQVNNFIVRGGRLYAGVNGNSRYVENPKYRLLQPRIGFAYRLAKNTVIRGGIGRFVQSSLNVADQGGFKQETQLLATNDNYATPYMSFANLFPSGKLSPSGASQGIYTNPGTNGTFNSLDIARPYVDEASVHLQHQIGEYLIEVGGTLNLTHKVGVNYNINLPSKAAWEAAYGPTFNASGTPINTFPGDARVTNPFRGAPYLNNNSLGSNSQISAYQLIRPNPLYGDWYDTMPIGKATYYALQSKIERRFKGGFSLMNSFTWSKKFLETGYFGLPGGTSQMISNKLPRQIDTADRKFMDSLSSTYILPFGRGKLLGRNVGKGLDRVIGGWEVSGIYSFASGTPIALPTNTAFYNPACDLSAGSSKSRTHWFNTDCFRPFPNSNTTYADLHDSQKYPTWTGVQNLPGYNYNGSGSKNGVYQDFRTWQTMYATAYGNVRGPWMNNFDLGLRKNIAVTERVQMQLRIDTFNTFNHPRFGLPNTDPSNKYFGYLNSGALVEANAPRAVQLGGRITF